MYVKQSLNIAIKTLIVVLTIATAIAIAFSVIVFKINETTVAQLESANALIATLVETNKELVQSNESLKEDKKVLQARLNNALIHEGTVAEAFKAHVSEPIKINVSSGIKVIDQKVITPTKNMFTSAWEYVTQ